jgi:peptidoglycan/xylan/chitin deacetylase (PgdA/CDA1 family)
VRSPDRRSALRTGFVVLGGAALAGCSDGKPSATSAVVPIGAAGNQMSAQAAAAQPAQPAVPSPAPAPSPVPSAPVAELDHATSGRKQVALTFHGDGDPKLALALLKEAESAGARLTVLAVGRWLGQYPEMAKRILDGGHELGNHTETHADITAMSPAAAYQEIEACAERLRKLTGSPGRWFRPSQTQHADATIVEQARKAGYQTVLSYDVDPLDYQDPPSSATAHRFLTEVQPGAVVSLHLGHPGTVAALPAMLDGLKQRGLTAVTASELFA